MSLVMEILEGLWNINLNYKGVRVNFFGVPMFFRDGSKYPQKSITDTFYRLKKEKLVEIKSGKWILTKLGKEYFENKNKLAVKFHSPFPLNSPKNLLLMFDIPESKRAERNWLRWHLKEFQYYMLQQSVWIGPSPLPKKFKEHAKNIGLNDYVKTFKLSKPYQPHKGISTF